MASGSTSESREATAPALWIKSVPQGEADALLTFFCLPQGAVLAKARSLRKAKSRLAGLLMPGDELNITLARGRGSIPVLTGVSTHRSHPAWRADIALSALMWLFLECAYIGSGEPELNQEVFQLVVNLLRNPPADDQRHGAAAVFGLKLLALHGLLPDFAHCAIDGHAIAEGEPVHLLPNGEGVIGREAYNRQYARTAGALIRLSPERLKRWRLLRRCSLLDYVEAEADAVDAALIVHHTARRLGETAGQQLASAIFLASQWKLPSFAEMLG
ncbi:recombination protein O N-terminal domain-containing protein [bacterium]|nr:recombination protein O N-terminal domain-containing protein [bacterium]